MARLANRSAVAATDGAAVNGTPAAVSIKGGAAAGLTVTLTGSPATYAVRAVIEGSFDGSVWHELVRFKDITNTATGNRIVRLPGSAAAAAADVAGDDLSAAEATGTQVDTPWPTLLRASTKLQTLTGGTTLTVTIAVFAHGG